jgi:predicted DNA-binding transcriptional regulator AlpA
MASHVRPARLSAPLLRLAFRIEAERVAAGATPVTTQTQAAAALGISMNAFWSLTSNAQFPRPTLNDGDGNVSWDPTAFATFQALWTAAFANGWKISVGDYPAANGALLATTSPGPYRYIVSRKARGSGAGLFD